MTDITPEAVAKGLVNLIDDGEPVIAGSECFIEFTQARGVEMTFTVTDDAEPHRAQHHFAATIRNAVDAGDLTDEQARDVDLVHNLILGGLSDDVDKLALLAVDGDAVTLKAPGRSLRITVTRS